MLAIVCAGVVLASLDLFIVNVALPQIGRDFHLSGGDLADLSWVLNAYAIVYAAFLVLFGGSPSATAASAASCSAWRCSSPRPPRAAPRAASRCWSHSACSRPPAPRCLTPTSLGLILATFPPERRYGAVRTWTAVGGLAAALGPVVGGLLVAASWRWVFFVNVPVGCSRSSSVGAGCRASPATRCRPPTCWARC